MKKRLKKRSHCRRESEVRSLLAVIGIEIDGKYLGVTKENNLICIASKHKWFGIPDKVLRHNCCVLCRSIKNGRAQELSTAHGRQLLHNYYNYVFDKVEQS